MNTDPIMAELLKSSSFVGMSETVEQMIMPLQSQLDFGPGDTAIVAMANTMLEGDLTVVRAVEPAEYADQFPDWVERMELRDHVLCEAFSKEDQEMSLGWFHRLKLIPIKEYRYKEFRSWRKNGYPDELPKWVTELLHTYTDSLSDKAPDRVPHRASCPKCKSRDVDLVVIRRIEYRAQAGVVQGDERETYIPLVQPTETSTHVAQLRCTNCESFASLDDEDWKFNDRS